MKKYLKKLKILFILVIFFVLFNLNMNAEYPDCPENAGGWSNPVTYYGPDGYQESHGNVDYKKRVNGSGRTEVIIDWATFYNPNPGLKDETVKDLLMAEIAITNSPPCPCTGTCEIAIIYRTECKVNTKCYLKSAYEQSTICCDDPNYNFQWLIVGGQGYAPINFWQSCGYKCCEKIYSYTCEWDAGHGVYKKVFSGSAPVTQTYPGSSCPPSTFIDCLYTPAVVPCEGNCD